MTRKITTIGVLVFTVGLLYSVPKAVQGAELEEQSFWKIHMGPLSVEEATNPAKGHFLPFNRGLAVPSYRGDLWLERTYLSSQIPSEANLAIDLGRISDADEAYWNGQLIGSTGFESPTGRFVPHLDRVYRIPQVKTGENILLVHVKKIAADIVGIGPENLSPRFGSYLTFSHESTIQRLIRTMMPLLLGFLIFSFGIYHLFLHFHLRPRRSYFHFGLFLACFGTYSICYSFWPYELDEFQNIVMRVHAVSSFWGLYFLGRYFVPPFNASVRFIHNAIFGSAVVGSIAALFASGFDGPLHIFLFWHSILVTGLIIFLGFGVYYWWRCDRRQWYPVASMFTFIAALVYDVLATNHVIQSEQIATPTFMLVLCGAVLVLGRDFAFAYVNVEETVEKRTRDLRDANERLRSLEQMKARFFANVSHDFKTPIAVALGVIEQAGNAALEPAQRSLNKLMNLIGTMLDTIKAESGTLKMEWETVPVVAFAEQVASPHRTLCESRGIELRIVTQGYEKLTVPMDSKKLERALDNLLSNAVKFTDRRSASDRKNQSPSVIEVKIRSDESRVYFEISDSGIGVPMDERAKIFDRYYQSSRTSLKEHGGSGIGLSFAKEMVELHRGQLWVEDSEFGGSKFSIALPLSQDVEITGEFEIDEEQLRGPAKGSLDVPYPTEVPAQINKLWPNILVTEDNPDVAQIVVSMLKEEFNVFFASNGRHALRILNEQRIDCVLTDFIMPEMKGDELIQEVRKQEKLKALPIFVLSSHADQETMLRLISLGANDYFTKPWNRELLLGRVRNYVRFYRMVTQEGNARRLQELGQIAAESNHQMKNRINKLQNYTTLKQLADTATEALHQYQPEVADKLKGKVGRIVDALEAGFNDTKQFMNILNGLSRGDETYGDVNVEKTVQDMLFLKKDQITEGAISVEVEGVKGLAFKGYSSYDNAVLNLISNAIDAVSKAGKGKVLIRGKEGNEQVLLSVQDNGYGISKQDLDRLGEIFYTTKSVNEGGTGWGLYIAKRNVEMMNGGKLLIESDGVGKGATFTVIVPKVVPRREDKGAKIHGVKV